MPAAKCLHQVAESVHKRSLIIIFSDMFDNMDRDGADELFSALFHRRFVTPYGFFESPSHSNLPSEAKEASR